MANKLNIDQRKWQIEGRQVYFQHIRVQGGAPKGGTTIAYIFKDPTHKTGGRIADVAQCHKDDHYCKQTGRIKSFGRLVSFLTHHPEELA